MTSSKAIYRPRSLLLWKHVHWDHPVKRKGAGIHFDGLAAAHAAQVLVDNPRRDGYDVVPLPILDERQRLRRTHRGYGV